MAPRREAPVGYVGTPSACTETPVDRARGSDLSAAGLMTRPAALKSDLEVLGVERPMRVRVGLGAGVGRIGGFGLATQMRQRLLGGRIHQPTGLPGRPVDDAAARH